jgi:hypothetical protein
MNSTTFRRLAGLPLAATLVVCAIMCFATAASAQKATKAEYQAVQQAEKIKDPAAKVAALESFLENDPQSVNNRFVYDTIGNAALSDLNYMYLKYGIDDKTLSGVNRVLEVDPNNLRAVLYSLYVRKGECEKTGDPQSCNDAIALAHRGLTLHKMNHEPEKDWEKVLAIFQSVNPEWQARYAPQLLAINAAAQAEQQRKEAAARAEQQKKDAATRAEQQARYDKVMNGGRPAQLYALAGDLEAEGRPDMAADLYQALIDNFPDDPYTAKAIDKKEAARAAAQLQAQQSQLALANGVANQQTTADCQKQCSAALNACKSNAGDKVQTGVAMGILGKVLNTSSVADSVTSVGSTAIDGYGACNDAYTSCKATCPQE